ncbi:zinc finger-domain protein [Angomonas deanei]|uniref:Zinc finger C-x8-C-x5-C-x3-H type (And similar), putative n=1 Tax=Angomonas deanei TaxID=59799 RepID=S9VG22_9TRYP|nr:zinc finger-domain protein [Angomonas deanei]EPY40993.1 zinc finger-domain protein [Angomonas deanei]CAD2217905.1 Zinc finger C-x8-C-x5-C-x3-H type (and similar), putative [Angomonas deanei]|eukprot:EPY39818.1 zinc finger-domain protein [Angomonas deanei]
MSFSVKAGDESPERSPAIHPYISPQMLPQSTQPSVPSFSLDDYSGKRVGTDPTKYKTSICRNWEQTGTCMFRSCTFAHGAEELRLPRAEHVSPVIHSTTSTPTLTHCQSNPKLEQLLEMLYSEVSRVREMASAYSEKNRQLESLLHQEQLHHEETKAQLEKQHLEYTKLLQLVAQRHASISNGGDKDAEIVLDTEKVLSDEFNAAILKNSSQGGKDQTELSSDFVEEERLVELLNALRT